MPTMKYPRPYKREIVFDKSPKLQLDFFDNAVIMTRREPSGWSSYPVDVSEVAKVLSGIPQSSGLLPQNTLGYGSYKGSSFYCIYIPPKSITIELANNDRLTIPIPPLVWRGWKQNYQIWALATEAYPLASTPLFMAPFPNVYTNAMICWGDSDDRLPAGPTTMQAMLDLFLIGSRFNTHLVGGKSMRSSGNIINLYHKIKGKAKYPLDDLCPADLVLENVLEGGFA